GGGGRCRRDRKRVRGRTASASRADRGTPGPPATPPRGRPVAATAAHRPRREGCRPRGGEARGRRVPPTPGAWWTAPGSGAARHPSFRPPLPCGDLMPVLEDEPRRYSSAGGPHLREKSGTARPRLEELVELGAGQLPDGRPAALHPTGEPA